MTGEGPGGTGDTWSGRGRGADAILASFARWSGTERARAAAAARASERWLRQQREETATLAGTLVDLAEEGTEVTLLVGPRRLTGQLAGVSTDCCVIESRDGSSSLVALGRLSAVWPATGRPGPTARPGPARGPGPAGRPRPDGRPGGLGRAGSPDLTMRRATAGAEQRPPGVGPAVDRAPGPASGDRVPELSLRFVDALAALAGDLAPVRLWLDGGEHLTGQLVAAGIDVVTLRLATSGRDHAYAPVRAIAVCTPV